MRIGEKAIQQHSPPIDVITSTFVGDCFPPTHITHLSQILSIFQSYSFAACRRHRTLQYSRPLINSHLYGSHNIFFFYTKHLPDMNKTSPIQCNCASRGKAVYPTLKLASAHVIGSFQAPSPGERGDSCRSISE